MTIMMKLYLVTSVKNYAYIPCTLFTSPSNLPVYHCYMQDPDVLGGYQIDVPCDPLGHKIL